MIDWTIWIANDKTCRYFALSNKNYTVIKEMKRTFKGQNQSGLRFTWFKDYYVKPRFSS